MAAVGNLKLAMWSNIGDNGDNFQVLCWRTVPVRNNQIGEVARSSEPFIRQAFVVDASDTFDEDDFKRRVFALRKRSTHTIPKPGRRFYICSLSHTIIVYKGQFTSDQLWAYFADLQVIHMLQHNIYLPQGRPEEILVKRGEDVVDN